MVPFAGLLAALEGIPDPRRRQGRRYSLAPLLLFSVLAVLAGATSYRGILTFIGVHRERLNATFGARFRRAPAVNTLRGLFLALDPADLEAAFRERARTLVGKAPASTRRDLADIILRMAGEGYPGRSSGGRGRCHDRAGRHRRHRIRRPGHQRRLPPRRRGPAGD